MYWINYQTRRFYRLTIKNDIFKGLLVVRDTGSLDSKQGRRMDYPVCSAIEAEEMKEEVIKQREKNGYVLVDEFPKLKN